MSDNIEEIYSSSSNDTQVDDIVDDDIDESKESLEQEIDKEQEILSNCDKCNICVYDICKCLNFSSVNIFDILVLVYYLGLLYVSLNIYHVVKNNILIILNIVGWSIYVMTYFILRKINNLDNPYMYIYAILITILGMFIMCDILSRNKINCDKSYKTNVIGYIIT